MSDWDVIVVGAGHAGCEASAIAARLGKRVAVVTLSLASVGRLSCNPAVGGQAKGHLVREIDALGGLMGRVADAACIQFRRLNTRKGLAVRASRAQVDIALYPQLARAALDALPTLTLIEGEAAGLLLRGGRVVGLALADGVELFAPAVILTTGTFLGGVMHRGEEKIVGGRVGDGAAHALSRSLGALGLKLGRLKTGTVPRLDRDSIDWNELVRQDDTDPAGRFSYGVPAPPRQPTVDCYMAYTNEAVHAHIRSSLHRSPMYSGAIVGRGPRYCPSIEDKVVRFADRTRHLLFLEPEGLTSDRVYVNGLSTSLPADVQDAVVHGIEGLTRARFLQYGYAVEYDHVDPTELGHDLQHREVRGLYLAGQVCGTSGYEEAAAQGLVAGLSAALGEPFRVGRHEAYIGVLVDDLVSRGIGGEPYRMFTSRAEHRLLLREDNADVRLMPRARSLGLVDDPTWAAFEARQEGVAAARRSLEERVLVPDAPTLAAFAERGLGGLKKPTTALELLRRPDVGWAAVAELCGFDGLSPEAAEQIEVDAKYEGYVAAAERRADQAAKMEHVVLPPLEALDGVGSLSTEVRDRIRRHHPATLGELARVPGVTPAAVLAVAVWLSRGSVGANARDPAPS